MIKNILKTILFLSIGVFSYALQINDIRFDKIMKKNENGEKIFRVINTEKDYIIYKMYVEGSDKVKVEPKVLMIKNGQEESFKVKVRDNRIGKHEYYLVFEEVKVIEKDETKSAKASLLKTIRILQKYEVVK